MDSLSIKKKKTDGHIYFAVKKDTGEIVPVDSVPSGLACNCVCAACGKAMEARKGEIRTHHFAHESNYDCLYSTEISIYKAFCSLLSEYHKIMLPALILHFNSYKPAEILKESGICELTDVTYDCAEGQYPPTLICYSGTSRLQVILDFNHYYDFQDRALLRLKAKSSNASLVFIDMPEIKDSSILEGLMAYVTENPFGRHWEYNRNIEMYRDKYEAVAVKPEMFQGRYLCAAQRRKHNNVYSCTREECSKCTYCFDIYEEAFCLASSYINHYTDFLLEIDERKKIFDEKNKIMPLKKIADYSCPKCGARLVKRRGSNGIFAGCSNFPICKHTYSVEQTTEQVIILDRRY